jgi:hypothetical protein
MKALSKSIVTAAEVTPLTDRFGVVEHATRPAMIVVDRMTGKATTVSLYAYGAVREALTELFGDKA